jgi:glycerophosphoryl diester phosphodiesterase
MTSILEAALSDLLPDGFDIQGHRGVRGLKPENTLPAFETALDLGVTTLELDLHLTVDGVVVVWHDPQIDEDKCRLDPGTAANAPDPDSLIEQSPKLMISNLTFEQLQAYRCDRNPDPNSFPDQNPEPTILARNDYRIVSLGELFDFVDAYSRSENKSAAQRQNASLVQFNVETKRVPDKPELINDGFDGVKPGPFEMAILKLVEERSLTGRVIIQSFDHRSLWAIRSIDMDIRLAALVWSGLSAGPADLAAKGANIWSPDAGIVTPALLDQAHEAGMAVLPWTVNEPDEMRRLIDMGVGGLISDRPDLLINLR